MKFLVDNNLSRAQAGQRVVISADTDFGTLLARSGAKIILANLEAVSADLDTGAVVVLTDEWVRIRRLPMLG